MLRGQRVGLHHVTEDGLPWLKRSVSAPQVTGLFMGSHMTLPLLRSDWLAMKGRGG